MISISDLLQGQTPWSQVTLPITSPSSGQLFELKVVSSNLVYTVGNKIGTPNQGLIFKYDGTAWTEMSNPVSGNGQNGQIKSIAPVSGSDIYILSGKRTIHHWNGSSWTDISSSLPNYNSNENFDNRTLFKMIAFASNDVWVVGKFFNTSSGQSDFETYAVHYDGSSWTEAVIPQSPKNDLNIAGLVMEVDASSASDIWIATRGYIDSPGMTQLGIWHYDGSNWTFDGEIISAAGNVFLRDVDVVSANDIWFAGYYSPAQGTLAALYIHYDGANYTYTNQPLPVNDYQRYCIAELNNSNVWSGHQTDGTDFTFFDGTNWSTQTTIITTTTGGGIRDMKRKSGCLWAVGYSGSNEPMLLENCLTPLPVELSHFEAKQMDFSVSLKWATEAEINSHLFEIQKSKDGIIWETFEVVEAAGNSSAPKEYEIFDYNPFIGQNYYRLKIIDFDATYEFSKIVSIYFNKDNEEKLMIYPNPTTGIVFLKGDKREVSGLVRIYNMFGQVMFQKDMNGSPQLDLSFLNNGVYILEYGNVLRKFVVRN